LCAPKSWGPTAPLHRLVFPAPRGWGAPRRGACPRFRLGRGLFAASWLKTILAGSRDHKRWFLPTGLPLADGAP